MVDPAVSEELQGAHLHILCGEYLLVVKGNHGGVGIFLQRKLAHHGALVGKCPFGRFIEGQAVGDKSRNRHTEGHRQNTHAQGRQQLQTEAF